LKLGRRDDAWPDLAKPSLDADLFLSVVPMSAHMGVRRGQGAAGELNLEFQEWGLKTGHRFLSQGFTLLF
jgi:hypothetical protein